MGFGSYTAADWVSLSKSAGIKSTSTASQLFGETNQKKEYDPVGITLRESRDSADHPESTPVIIGFDVTGSMGFLAEEIARNSLNQTMTRLYEEKPLSDPQVMIAAIGDVRDKAPLQVTHFESDIRVAKQLLELWLEMKGQDAPEDYPLLWYFAAHHTVTDNWVKRRKRGVLFTIGDADCHPLLEAGDLNRIFCGAQERGPVPAAAAAAAAGETFELIHIHLTGRLLSRVPELEKAIPGRVIRLSREQVSLLPDVIIGVLRMLGGADAREAAGGSRHGELYNCLSQLRLQHGEQGFSF